jgi:alpha-1,2-mannosyltransferase
MPVSSSTVAATSSRVTASRVVHLASIVVFGALPALVVAALFASAIEDDVIAMDFHQFYRAAEIVLEGGDPYPAAGEPLTDWGGPYPYPPLPALLVTPLTVLPFEAAGLLLMAALVGVALAIPLVLGVRDWRCYGLVLLWPPVISAIQTSNLTLWLALLAALTWRYRDRSLVAGASIGVTLAAKFFLWPIVVWLAATRRLAAAALSCAVGAGLLVLSWAAIGFAGLVDYPDLLRRLEETVGEDSYTAYILALDTGLPEEAARGVWLVVGLGALAGVVALARRGDERSSFILGIAAALALTPIVWLHYFALLAVPVALAQPTLGVVWFVPLAMVLTPGSGHPAPVETAATLAIATLTVGLALRASRADSAGRRGAVGAPVHAP